MQTLDNLHSHRSIRKYKNQAVPEETLTQILEAGIRASSSGNMQAYSIIVTTEPLMKEKLYEPHRRQSMVLEAPVLMTFCADFHRMKQWLKLSEAPDSFDNFMSLMIGTIDAVLVSQACAMAAEDFGLGICYMGSTLANGDEIGKILKLPKHVLPIVGYSLGYPDEAPNLRDRLPLSGLVHRETYQDYDDQAIQKIYASRAQKGWERYMKIEELRQQVEKSGAQNLAQIYTMLKYSKESQQHLSKKIMEYVAEQGWMSH